MNIDQRLEALTIRNLKLVGRSGEAQDRRIEKLTASIEKLVGVTNEDPTNIRTLAGIVQSHERRISDIERTN